MKVIIGPHEKYFGTYQLAEKICFWTKTRDEYGLPAYPDWVHDFGEWLTYGSVEKEETKTKRRPFLNSKKERPTTLLYKFLNWIHNKKDRKIEIQIDKWDTWGMDHTLAVIILPMLKQLKDTKHGSPFVDDEDVPEGLGLRSTEAPPFEEWESDDNVHRRWDWVMDEMIWAFEQILDDDADRQFHSGEHDTIMVPINKDGDEITDENEKPNAWRMDQGPEDTHVYDVEGHKAWQARVTRGTTLFGKYYQGLWD